MKKLFLITQPSILIEQSTIQIIGVDDGWFRGYNLFPVD